MVKTVFNTRNQQKMSNIRESSVSRSVLKLKGVNSPSSSNVIWLHAVNANNIESKSKGFRLEVHDARGI